MKFREALRKLGIEDYHDRIFNASPTGELYHLWGYAELAEKLGTGPLAAFRGEFEYLAAEGARYGNNVFCYIPDWIIRGVEPL